MAKTQISRNIFLIKVDNLYLDLYFSYIKNSELQIFQKDQLKCCFKIFARHVLHNINLFVFTMQHRLLPCVFLGNFYRARSGLRKTLTY